jgi:eukaryotic-like serine/threonine-protein kinase
VNASDPQAVPGYQLQDLLGRGGFGEVWGAVREADGMEVALKLLREPAFEEARLRFRREASAAAQVESDHVCRVLDAGTDGPGPLYIAYERLQGETLEARLDRDGDLSLGETLPIVAGLLDALSSAHAAGIVHRDVKPSNVFLERLGDGAARARLLDFGVAKAPGEPDLPLRTTCGATLGSLEYMAPEQAGAAATVDGRADLYGLGAVIFRALAGRPPFATGTPATLLALKLDRDPPSLGEVTGVTWPSAVEAFLRRLLACDPARRFPSAAAAAEAFEALADRVRAVVGGA